MTRPAMDTDDVGAVPEVRSAKAARRRNRTRQREELLAVLRGCETHPTAGELFDILHERSPRLALGTVYRNLEVLVSQGLIDEVPVPRGPVRYDGNPTPHHHFVCDACGEILDVEVPTPRALVRTLAREHELEAHRLRIQFFGLCPTCRDRHAAQTQ